MNSLILLLPIFPSLCLSLTLYFNQSTPQHFISLKNLSTPQSALELNLIQLSPKSKESLFTARKSKNPFSEFNNSETWSIKSDISDLDSWISNSANHSLQLDQFNNWKLGIFTYSLQDQVKWKLTITGLSTFHIGKGRCGNSCSEKGKCIEGKCVCGDYYAGNDCSIPIQAGKLNRVYDLALLSDTYYYYSFNLTSSFVCEISKKSPVLAVFSKKINSG